MRFISYLEDTSRPWSKEGRDAVDKQIENVIYETKEEFFRLYKKRDERIKSLLQDHILKLAKSDRSFNIKSLVEENERLQLQSKQDIQLMLNKPQDGDFLQEEIDDDEEITEEDSLTGEEATAVNKKDQDISTLSDTLPSKKDVALEEVDPRFIYKPPSRPSDEIYKNYEDIQIYRNELDGSAEAGYDRLMAHLKARERANVRKDKIEEKSISEEVNDYLKFMGDPDVQRIQKLDMKRMKEEMEATSTPSLSKSALNIEIPTATELKHFKVPHERGRGSDLDEIRKVARDSKNIKRN